MPPLIEKQKESRRKYRETHKELLREYRQRPEVKARLEEYQNRPEVKRRIAEYHKQPEVKIRNDKSHKIWREKHHDKIIQKSRENRKRP